MVVGAQYAVRGIQFRNAGAGDYPEAAFAVFDRRADRVVVQSLVVGDDREPFGFGVEDIQSPVRSADQDAFAAVGEDRRDAVARDGIPVVGGVAGQFAGRPVAVEAAAAGSDPKPVVGGAERRNLVDVDRTAVVRHQVAVLDVPGGEVFQPVRRVGPQQQRVARAGQRVDRRMVGIPPHPRPAAGGGVERVEQSRVKPHVECFSVQQQRFDVVVLEHFARDSRAGIVGELPAADVEAQYAARVGPDPEYVARRFGHDGAQDARQVVAAPGIVVVEQGVLCVGVVDTAGIGAGPEGACVVDVDCFNGVMRKSSALLRGLVVAFGLLFPLWVVNAQAVVGPQYEFPVGLFGDAADEVVAPVRIAGDDRVFA